jgi:hypothetical protein
MHMPQVLACFAQHDAGYSHGVCACVSHATYIPTESRHACEQPHRKMHILLHDCNSSAVDSAEIGIFKEAYQECLGGFLKGKHCI